VNLLSHTQNDAPEGPVMTVTRYLVHINKILSFREIKMIRVCLKSCDSLLNYLYASVCDIERASGFRHGMIT
jgi:hypothetical protein